MRKNWIKVSDRLGDLDGPDLYTIRFGVHYEGIKEVVKILKEK